MKDSHHVKISQIKFEGEYRGSHAELKMLTESMRELGQLQDIILNSRLELIGGRRRVEAAKRLGWKSLRALVNPAFDDKLKALKAERDENCPGCRVPLTRKQQLELARKLEVEENPQAAARKAATQAKKGQKVGAGNDCPVLDKGRVRDKIGEVVGMSGRTLEKAQAVIDAAQDQPERYKDLGDKVNTDNQPIDPVHQEFRDRQEIYNAAERDKRFAEIAERLTVTHDTEKAKAEYEQLRDEQSKDKTGQPIPKRLHRVFNVRWAEECTEAIEYILQNQLKATLKLLVKNADCEWLSPETTSAVEGVVDTLKTVRAELDSISPYAVCHSCSGVGCKACRGSGWLTKEAWQKRKVGA